MVISQLIYFLPASANTLPNYIYYKDVLTHQILYNNFEVIYPINYRTNYLPNRTVNKY